MDGIDYRTAECTACTCLYTGTCIATCVWYPLAFGRHHVSTICLVPPLSLCAVVFGVINHSVPYSDLFCSKESVIETYASKPTAFCTVSGLWPRSQPLTPMHCTLSLPPPSLPTLSFSLLSLPPSLSLPSFSLFPSLPLFLSPSLSLSPFLPLIHTTMQWLIPLNVHISK